MTLSPGAFCTDFYVNQKLALKMDLPTGRETVLDMCDRIRKAHPQMDRFRRFDGELALESPDEDSTYSWFSLQQTSVRSGWVNPETLAEAYQLHRLILEVSPYYLSISPLDVEHLELVFGFDLEAAANRNEIVFDALLADSMLCGLVDADHESVLDAQPFIGFSLSTDCGLQAYIEIKSRTQPAEVASGLYREEPISVYLTVRKYGPLKAIRDFGSAFATLAGYAERLAEERVIPQVVMPIRETILTRPG